MKLKITDIHGWQGTETTKDEAIGYMQNVLERMYPSVNSDGEGFCHLILGNSCGPGTGMNNIPSRAATYAFSDHVCQEMPMDIWDELPDDVQNAVAEDTPFYHLKAEFV